MWGSGHVGKGFEGYVNWPKFVKLHRGAEKPMSPRQTVRMSAMAQLKQKVVRAVQRPRDIGHHRCNRTAPDRQPARQARSPCFRVSSTGREWRQRSGRWGAHSSESGVLSCAARSTSRPLHNPTLHSPTSNARAS